MSLRKNNAFIAGNLSIKVQDRVYTLNRNIIDGVETYIVEIPAGLNQINISDASRFTFIVRGTNTTTEPYLICGAQRFKIVSNTQQPVTAGDLVDNGIFEFCCVSIASGEIRLSAGIDSYNALRDKPTLNGEQIINNKSARDYNLAEFVASENSTIVKADNNSFAELSKDTTKILSKERPVWKSDTGEFAIATKSDINSIVIPDNYKGVVKYAVDVEVDLEKLTPSVGDTCIIAVSSQYVKYNGTEWEIIREGDFLNGDYYEVMKLPCGLSGTVTYNASEEMFDIFEDDAGIPDNNTIAKNIDTNVISVLKVPGRLTVNGEVFDGSTDVEINIDTDSIDAVNKADFAQFVETAVTVDSVIVANNLVKYQDGKLIDTNIAIENILRKDATELQKINGAIEVEHLKVNGDALAGISISSTGIYEYTSDTGTARKYKFKVRPEGEYEFATTSDLLNKVDKVTDNFKLYGTSTGGNQVAVDYAESNAEWTIAQRGANGALNVGNATKDTHAVNKSQLDTELSKKVDIFNEQYVLYGTLGVFDGVAQQGVFAMDQLGTTYNPGRIPIRITELGHSQHTIVIPNVPVANTDAANKQYVDEKLNIDPAVNNLLEVPIICEADVNKFLFTTPLIVNGGFGYAAGDTVVAGLFELFVTDCENGVITGITFADKSQYEQIYDENYAGSYNVTGGSGSEAVIRLRTYYANGSEIITGRLEHVTDNDPLTQKTYVDTSIKNATKRVINYSSGRLNVDAALDFNNNNFPSLSYKLYEDDDSNVAVKNLKLLVGTVNNVDGAYYYNGAEYGRLTTKQDVLEITSASMAGTYLGKFDYFGAESDIELLTVPTGATSISSALRKGVFTDAGWKWNDLEIISGSYADITNLLDYYEAGKYSSGTVKYYLSDIEEKWIVTVNATGNADFKTLSTDETGAIGFKFNSDNTLAGADASQIRVDQASGDVTIADKLTQLKTDIDNKQIDTSNFAKLNVFNAFGNGASWQGLIRCNDGAYVKNKLWLDDADIIMYGPVVNSSVHQYYINIPRKDGTIAMLSDLPDTSHFANLDEQNNFHLQNCFLGGICTDWNLGIQFNGENANEYGPWLKLNDAGDFVIDDERNKTELKFPAKSGTIATTEDLPTIDTSAFAKLNTAVNFDSVTVTNYFDGLSLLEFAPIVFRGNDNNGNVDAFITFNGLTISIDVNGYVVDFPENENGTVALTKDIKEYSEGTGISISGTTISLNLSRVASSTQNGLMSSTDKAKLDGYEIATTADIDALFN